MHSLALQATVLAAAVPQVIRRADRPDERYLALGARYPAVIALGRVGDATLIAPDWLLTAAHVANAVRSGRAGNTIRIGAKGYRFDRVVLHPSWRELGDHDIGLIHLSQHVDGLHPIPIHRGSTEVNSIATIVGHGGSGAGDAATRIEDGRARAATSRVDSASAVRLYFSFDAPPGGTDLEGAPGPGDSGGPALLITGGSPTVAGISSAGFDGRTGPGSYGAVDVFTRVSTHAAWIDSVMRSAEPTVVRNEGVASQDSVTLPGTQAGRRFAAFLAAMHAGTDSAIVRFLTANFDTAQLRARSAEQRLPNFRQLAVRLRDATIAAVEHADSVSVKVRLATPDGPVVIELLYSPDSASRITDWRRYD
jgi:hypothetical protein